MARSNILILIGVVFFLDLMNPVPEMAMAQESEPKGFQTLTLHFENDTFFGTDYLYTNGIKLSWTSPDLDNDLDDSGLGAWTYSLIGRLPFANKPDLQRSASLSIGQNIYTPEDTERKELIEDDRPYAGVIYASAALHGKSNLQMNTWEVMVGIVGPHSYAGDTQKTIHRWLNKDIPEGWSHQLEDEPVLNIYFERRTKLWQSGIDGGWGYDIIPNWGGGLGNFVIGAHAGAQIRFGWNLPNDFGKSLIRPGSDTNAPPGKRDPGPFKPSNRFGLHVFAGVDGAYVLRNLTLDGNTCQESHSVHREPLVATFIAGVGFNVYGFKINFAHVYQTKEFETQEDEDEYGSMTLSYTF